MSIFYRIKVELEILFKVAFHIGSGLEGNAGSDNGIVTDKEDYPYLPGSTLKGIFRSNVEKLLGALSSNVEESTKSDEPKMLWGCGLENGLYQKEKKCIGGGIKDTTYKEANKTYQDSNGKDLSFMKDKCCNVCQLFGSPLNAARIYIDDSYLQNKDEFALSQRNGVGIHRDSGASVDQVKYDYDVANPNLIYKILIEAEQVTQEDMEILSLGLSDWQHAGIRIGGKTSRGLGHAEVKNIDIFTLDMKNKDQRKAYLLEGRMTKQENVEKFFDTYLDELLSRS